MDVTSKESLAAAAEVVRVEEGYLNALIANSGIVGPNTSKLFADSNVPSLDELHSALWDVDMADFTQTLHVNVTGAFYTTMAFLKLLDEGNRRQQQQHQQKSQVIVTTSVAAFTRSPAAGFAYSASKAAATHLVKQLSTCLAPYKIRANALAPGFFPSEMTEGMPWMQGQDPRVEGNVSSKIVPLERTGTEDEIAGLVLYLLSRAGGYVNGSVQLVDGGRIGVVPGAY